MLSKEPNAAHIAIANFQKHLRKDGRECTVITQNIDELHKRAGSDPVLELHGSLFRVRCTICGKENVNYDSPICPALAGTGDPDETITDSNVPREELPHCDCGKKGLLRPAVVWFGEPLDPNIMHRADQLCSSECD